MAPLGLTADSNSNTNNGTPISLLWAHQLRREHAAIVAQLDELKHLHPPSLASKLNKLVARTERAEAAHAEIRKELVQLKGTQQETVKGLEGGKEREERFRAEIEGLRQLLTRQGGQLSALVDEVRKVQRRVEEGRDEKVEQKLLRNEEEILELKGLVQALERRVGDAVTVVRDSVGRRTSDSGGEMTAGYIASVL